MDHLTASEVAQRAAVPVAFVERLVELGIIVPRQPGRFTAGDLQRTRLMLATEEAGLPLEGVAAALAAGRFSLAFLELSHFRWSPRSDTSYAQLAADSGLPVDYLLSFEETTGVQRPEPGDPVREDLLAMLPVLTLARDAGIDDAIMPRIIRVYTEALRRVAEAEGYVYHNYIELPMLQSGLTQAQIVDQANAFGETVTPAQETMILGSWPCTAASRRRSGPPT
jgi:adenylate cyclase